MTREDYNISDSTKLFVRYNYQRETQQFPVGLWWRNGAQVPYPTAVEGKNRSKSISGSLTHVFSPTMTNELVVAYTEVLFPNVFADPAVVNRTQRWLQRSRASSRTVFPRFRPSEASATKRPWSSIRAGSKPAEPSQGLYANKYMPSISDTLTKVWGKHTLKGGFFWEWIRNAQPANNDTNGQLQFVSSKQLPVHHWRFLRRRGPGNCQSLR